MGTLRPILERYIAAARKGNTGEVRRLLLEAKIKAVSIEEITMSDLSVYEVDSKLEPESTDGRTKRRGGGRRGTNGVSPAVEPVASTVALTPAQLEKLWRLTVGGRLVIECDEESGEVVCHVGVESILPALPVLLERL